MKTDPAYRKTREGVERHAQKMKAKYKNGLLTANDEPITIPVVVHIIWHEAEDNLADDVVERQMITLNRWFNPDEEDLANMPQSFRAIAGKMNLRFELAQWQDEEGQWHEAITRTHTAVEEFTESDQKRSNTGGHDVVRPAEYLNIWVCQIKGPLGFATYPGRDPRFDGVVVDTDAFGYTQHITANQGKTLVHEVGHWVNLKHPWGDEYDICGDDLVDDTPRHKEPNYGCPSIPHRPNYCEPGNDRGEMFMNFMDYTDDNCKLMFSKGQVARARAVFSSGGIRETFLNSGFLANTNRLGLQNACQCAPPDNPRLTEVRGDYIEMRWGRLAKGQEYEVRYKKSASGTWKTLPRERLRRAFFDKLHSSTLYTLQVRAYCKDTGQYSAWRSIITTTRGASCPALNVLRGRLSGTSVEYSWPNTPAYNYVEVSYFEQAENGVNIRKSLETSSNSIRIDNLKPGTSYLFKFTAHCHSHNTIDDDRVVTPACYAVENLRHELAGDGQTSVNLLWDLPADAPDLFEVEVVDEATGATAYFSEAAPANQQVTVTGLTAGNTYKAEVTSICDDNFATSNTLTFTTNTTQPNFMTTPEQASVLSVAVAPNPARHQISVSVADPEDGAQQNPAVHAIDASTYISIADPQGREVYHQAYNQVKNSYNLPLSNIPSGVYMIEVLRQGRVARQRFVVGK